MKIDLVYLWVDGSDPVWQAKKNSLSNASFDQTRENCKGRFTDNDELRYSLRSIEKYAPWINMIYIVTDAQTPHWLNTDNPKIKIIDHKQILPEISIPCFNSRILEQHLYKIPDLSEHFIYANDDMFINKPIQPSTFFTVAGFPVIRLVFKPFRRFSWWFRTNIMKKGEDSYRKAINHASKLVKQRFGTYYNGKPHHNIDAYLKSDCKRVVEELFKEELAATHSNHIRSFNDVQVIIFRYVALAEKRGCLRYVGHRESFHAQINKINHYQKLIRYNPTFFCFNDTEYASDAHRERAKAWIKDRFPEKSSYEK